MTNSKYLQKASCLWNIKGFFGSVGGARLGAESGLNQGIIIVEFALQCKEMSSAIFQFGVAACAVSNMQFVVCSMKWTVSSV